MACQALCCVALAFDAGPDFAVNKPAHHPCAFLKRDDRCSIHGRLERRGFSGCVSYDCYGAGQRVTQRFKGVTWRQSRECAEEIFEAFRTIRIAHELMAMLTLAIDRCADDGARNELHAQLRSLEARCEDPTSLQSADLTSLRRDLLRLARLRAPSKLLDQP